MKKLLLIALLIVGAFAQNYPYISTGINISLNNKGKGIISANSGIRWGYEITGGYMAGPLHLKISYGKKHFINSNQFINYYAYGAGLAIIGYEKGFAKLIKENKDVIKGERYNIYSGGFIYPIAIAWDVTGIVEAGILPTNFYSREKFVFIDTTFINHNFWQKFAIPLIDCVMCN